MTKHQPERMCVACRSRKPQSELLRVVKSPQHQPEPDVNCKKPGRGAYVCYAEKCMRLAVKKRAFAHHLKATSEASLLNQLLDLLHARR